MGQVAERLGVWDEAYRRWERDSSPPRLRHLAAIEQFLGMTPEVPAVGDLGTRLRAWRRTHGYSRARLASRIHVNKDTLARIEGGLSDRLTARVRGAVEGLLGGER